MSKRLKAYLIVVAVLVAVFVLWFASRSTRKAEVKTYAITGIVVDVHPDSGTASVHNDNIPGFMQPMEMEYKVADPAVLAKVKRGDNIRATLVSDRQNVWRLENIAIIPPPNAR